MNTILTDWYIIQVMDGNKLKGEVLAGVVLDDDTIRFFAGDFISTSQIKKINPNTRLVTTATGSEYKVIGNGKRAIIDFDDFELLRNGFSPEQIRALNRSYQLVAH